VKDVVNHAVAAIEDLVLKDYLEDAVEAALYG